MRWHWVPTLALCGCDQRTVEVFYSEYREADGCIDFEDGSAVRPYSEWKQEFSRSDPDSGPDVDLVGQTLEGVCLVFLDLEWQGVAHRIQDYPRDEEWLVDYLGDPPEGLPECTRYDPARRCP